MQTDVNIVENKNSLVFTEGAANKVKTLIEDEKNPNLNFIWIEKYPQLFDWNCISQHPNLYIPLLENYHNQDLIFLFMYSIYFFFTYNSPSHPIWGLMN